MTNPPTLEPPFLANLFDWPDLGVAAAVLLAAVAGALIGFSILAGMTRRLLGARYPAVLAFIDSTRDALRFAAVLFALRLVVTSVPLDGDTSAMLAIVFQVGFIVLVGWLAIVAVRSAARFYLRRFESGTADSLLARKHLTQVRILVGLAKSLIIILTIAAVLMSFETVRQFGVSLVASAGLAGVAIGFAARPILSNLIAGIQIAITQPIHIDDLVTVEGETGRVEEITATYVVVRLWDKRALIVPLGYFIEKPFQNLTRGSSQTLGTLYLHVDPQAPVARIREEFLVLVRASPYWDGEVAEFHVTDTRSGTVELRGLVSARNGGDSFNLRCDLREKLIDFLLREHPDAFPRVRQETVAAPEHPPNLA